MVGNLIDLPANNYIILPLVGNLTFGLIKKQKSI